VGFLIIVSTALLFFARAHRRRHLN
jgi:hypothetical protein